MAVVLSERVVASVSTGDITLPSWTPAANDLILVAVIQRDEAVVPTLSGNGLTFVEVIDKDDSQGQTGVVVFRAMGANPTAGAITVSLPGNTLPGIAVAARFAGADTSGTNGSGAVEATASAETGATDNSNASVTITTLSDGALVVGALAVHGTATLTLTDEGVISVGNQVGTSANLITGHMIFQQAGAAGSVTLLGNSSLSAAREWAFAALSIKPVTAPVISITGSQAKTFLAPASSMVTDSWTPVANELLLALVGVRTSSSSPASSVITGVSGNGLTWVKVADIDDTQNATIASAWRAMGASPSSGAVTVSLGVSVLNGGVHLVRLAGVKQGGTNGSAAIGATSVAETGATDTASATTNITTTQASSRIILFASGRNHVYTPGAGFSAIHLNQLVDTSGNVGKTSSAYGDFNDSGQTIAAHFTQDVAGDWSLVAIEVLANLSTPVTVTPAVDAVVVAQPTATISAQRTITVAPAVDAVVVGQPAATVDARRAVTVAPAVDAVVVTDPVVTVDARRSATITPVVGAVVVAGPTITIIAQRSTIVTPAVDTVVVTDPVVTVDARHSVTVMPAIDAVVVGQPAATAIAQRSVTVTPAVDAVVVTDPVVTVAFGTLIAPTVDTVVVGQPAATILAQRTVTTMPAVGVVAVTDPAVTVIAQRTVTVTPAVDAVVIGQPAASAVTGRIVAVAVDVITIGQPAATVIAQRVVAAAPAVDAVVIAQPVATVIAQRATIVTPAVDMVLVAQPAATAIARRAATVVAGLQAVAVDQYGASVFIGDDAVRVSVGVQAIHIGQPTAFIQTLFVVALTTAARTFSLTTQARDFSLNAPERSFSLTAKPRRP